MGNVTLRLVYRYLQRSSPKLDFTGGDRAVLAALLRLLGKRHRSSLKLVVTPRTVLRWHARLVAKKWTCPPRRPGRPAEPGPAIEVLRKAAVSFVKESDR
ncbi:hypothetical protein ACWC9U_36400 [Streptomyces sp. 900116325]